MEKLPTSLAFVLVVFAGAASAQDKVDPPRQQNGLSLRPPMGWNSWNKFACNIHEELVRQAADQMIATGLHQAGYEYVVSVC